MPKNCWDRCWTLAALALVVSAGCGKPAAPVTLTSQDSHQLMLAALQEIQSRTSEENEYLGDGPVRRLEQQLANIPPGTHPVQVLRGHWEFAEGLLRVGETARAIKQFEVCAGMLSDVASFMDVTPIQNELQFKTAVAFLRLAENENCVHCRDENCCIFPIREGGIHVNKEPSQNAIKQLNAYLTRNPEDTSAIWLLNVAAMTVGQHDEVPERWRTAASLGGDADFPRFTNIASRLGLDNVSLCGGMVVDDLDGDGWLDMVTSDWDTSGQIRIRLSNHDGTFRETTKDAGLTGLYGGLNLLQADYDNDGDVDIFVLRGAWLDSAGRHPNSLLQNDGKGHFRDVTFAAGLGENHYPTQSAAWADYDNDGDLDLYVANEIGPSELYNNDGKGSFRNVAFEAGVANGGSPKGVIWGDYDNDRFPDLFVSNLTGKNRMFHNNGDGTFTNVADELGVAGPERSFPTWFWDFNNDGALDLFVAGYSSHIDHFAADYLGQGHEADTDRLYQGDGKGGFRDVTEAMNLDRVTLPMGSNFGDVDNDGFQDFYLGTGYPDYEGIMPNRMFHNQNGKGFAEVTTAAGLGHLQKGHGVAFADFDHDGDQDIFIQMGGAFPGDAFGDALFQNPGFGNHWIAIKLVGKRSNRSAIGVRVRADVTEDGKSRSIYKWVNSGGSFGASPLRQHLGLGKANTIDRLEIYWPTTDMTQVFHDVAADQLIEIEEGIDEVTTMQL